MLSFAKVALVANLLASVHVLRWKPVARQLGLHWHRETGRMSGFIDDRFVAAWNDHGWIASVALWPPLDLILKWDVESDEPTRNAKVVMAARRAAGMASFDLRKDFVSVLSRMPMLTRDQLKSLVERVLSIARAIDAVRADVPNSPAALAHLAPFHDLARARRMTLRHTPLGYFGAQRKIELQFFLARRGFDWCLKAFARFRAPLGIGFNARSRSMGLERPWGLSPLRTGDAEFDHWFEVSAFETAYVRQALSSAARARLSALAERGMWIVVHDLGVVAELRVPSPKTLDELLDELCGIAELVNFTLPKSTAYR